MPILQIEFYNFYKSYPLKNNILTALLLLSLSPLWAQLNCDDLDFDIPILPNCEARLPTEVALFNIMANHYGLKDTIQYQCTGRTIQYTYKGESVSDWKYNPKDCGQRFMLSGGKTSINFRFIASIPTGNNKATVYEMVRPEKERRRVFFKMYQEEGILPFGKYVEKNCAGQITAEGEYTLTNEPSSYSYHWYDEEKRASIVETIESDKTSIRKGTWKFYDEEGSLINKTNYPASKADKQIYSDSLCGDYDKTYQYNYYKNEKIPTGVAMYNDINAMIGRSDYLSYDVTHRGVVYYLNGQLIQSPFYTSEDGYKDFSYQMEQHTGNLLLESSDNTVSVYTRSKKDQGELLTFKNNILDIFQTNHFQPDGSFERWNCKGQITVKGQYSTIDTFYTITKESFSPETYETIISVTEIDKITLKTGTWSYYNNAGEHIADETYPGATVGAVYNDYLCAVVTPENNEIRRTLPNHYVLFNAMCQQFDLPYWISNDLVLGNHQTYFNGQPVEAPTTLNLRNNATETKLKTPVGDIKINTKSNDYAAGGTMGRPKVVTYSAVITFPDDQAEVLLFSDNKLTRYKSLYGRKSGPYEERQCNGNLIVLGQYCQVDTVLRDTSVVFNPETYEEEIVITTSYVHSKKTGTWTYYDINGIVEKQEEFGRCK